MTSHTSERTVVLLRHAKAEQVDGKVDHDRELAPRGRKDARATGEWLRDASEAGALPSGAFDLVLCSTSVRTRQTLDAVCGSGASVTETRYDERIYNAAAATLLDVLREVPESVDTVLVIGHAPGVPVLATALVHEGAGSADAAELLLHGFPTSGVAVLGFEGPWSSLAPEGARLRDFVVPRG